MVAGFLVPDITIRIGCQLMRRLLSLDCRIPVLPARTRMQVVPSDLFVAAWLCSVLKRTIASNPRFHICGVFHRRAGSETPLAGGWVLILKSWNPEICSALNGL